MLGEKLSSTSVIKGIRFIYQEAKDNTCRHLETMEKCVNSAFYAQVVVEDITIEVAELRSISF